jgi:hypothetical protein
MAYTVTHRTYRLSMTDGTTHDFGDLDLALDWALEHHGCHSSYECEDGRVLLYADDEAMDADETGASAMGAIEVIEEQEELEPDYDDYQARRPYCSDRTCGATDCSVCYGWA